jgi:hypothetical protein
MCSNRKIWKYHFGRDWFSYERLEKASILFQLEILVAESVEKNKVLELITLSH